MAGIDDLDVGRVGNAGTVAVGVDCEAYVGSCACPVMLRQLSWTWGKVRVLRFT